MLLPSHQAEQVFVELVVPVAVEHENGKAGSSKSVTAAPEMLHLHVACVLLLYCIVYILLLSVRYYNDIQGSCMQQ